MWLYRATSCRELGRCRVRCTCGEERKRGLSRRGNAYCRWTGDHKRWGVGVSQAVSYQAGRGFAIPGNNKPPLELARRSFTSSMIPDATRPKSTANRNSPTDVPSSVQMDSEPEGLQLLHPIRRWRAGILLSAFFCYGSA